MGDELYKKYIFSKNKYINEKMNKQDDFDKIKYVKNKLYNAAINIKNTEKKLSKNPENKELLYRYKLEKRNGEKALNMFYKLKDSNKQINEIFNNYKNKIKGYQKGGDPLTITGVVGIIFFISIYISMRLKRKKAKNRNYSNTLESESLQASPKLSYPKLDTKKKTQKKKIF